MTFKFGDKVKVLKPGFFEGAVGHLVGRAYLADLIFDVQFVINTFKYTFMFDGSALERVVDDLEKE